MLQFGLPEISHGKHLWKKNVQHCRVPKIITPKLHFSDFFQTEGVDCVYVGVKKSRR